MDRGRAHPLASPDVRRWLVPPVLFLAAAVAACWLSSLDDIPNADVRTPVVARVTSIGDVDGAPAAWLDLPAARYDARAVASLPVEDLHKAGRHDVGVGKTVTVWAAVDDPLDVAATADAPVTPWLEQNAFGVVLVMAALVWLAARLLVLDRARRVLRDADHCFRMAAVLDTSRRWTSVDLLPVDPTPDTPPVARLDVLVRRGRYTSGVADVDVYGVPGAAQLAVPVLGDDVLWPAGRASVTAPRRIGPPSRWRRVGWALLVPVVVAGYIFTSLAMNVRDVRASEADSTWTNAEVVAKDDMYLLLRYDLPDRPPQVGWADVDDESGYRIGQHLPLLVGDLHAPAPTLAFGRYDPVPIVVWWSSGLAALAFALWWWQNHGRVGRARKRPRVGHLV
jgi:hypothetical protein